jgi:hypothetical protein
MHFPETISLSVHFPGTISLSVITGTINAGDPRPDGKGDGVDHTAIPIHSE